MSLHNRLFAFAMLTPALLSVGACSAPRPGEAGSIARQSVPIINSAGAVIGEITLSERANAVHVALSARDLPPGLHGFHIHMTGKCEAPAFTSAGSHWNPGQHQHGTQNPQGTHAGDLPNLTVAADGTVRFETNLQGLAMKQGALAILDADGAAFVIHADPDDEKTDPTGNSGARIACAAFSPQ